MCVSGWGVPVKTSGAGSGCSHTYTHSPQRRAARAGRNRVWLECRREVERIAQRSHKYNNKLASFFCSPNFCPWFDGTRGETPSSRRCNDIFLLFLILFWRAWNFYFILIFLFVFGPLPVPGLKRSVCPFECETGLVLFSSSFFASEDREVVVHKWCFCGTQNTVKKKLCLSICGWWCCRIFVVFLMQLSSLFGSPAAFFVFVFCNNDK